VAHVLAPEPIIGVQPLTQHFSSATLLLSLSAVRLSHWGWRNEWIRGIKGVNIVKLIELIHFEVDVCRIELDTLTEGV
jgi:hypothetical protein